MKKCMMFFAAFLCVLMLGACTAVQVSGELMLNADGSGTRKIVGRIAKQDYQDGYGSAYYYFKQHGEELAASLEQIYAKEVEGSGEWLKITVDDSGSDWETITLSFDFSSLEEYAGRLRTLAYNENFAGNYTDPQVTVEGGQVTGYSESTAVMTAIFKSLQSSVMEDEALYDERCTKDGEALNDGSADGQLLEYGVELIKPENGSGFDLVMDGKEMISLAAVDGMFTYAAAGSGEEETNEVGLVLDYRFDGDLTNSGKAQENDLVMGSGSTSETPVFTEGIDGQAVLFDGASYLASPNKTYSYKEMTISFYYRMDAYTETDTGANMVLVPAGLGALGSGVVDVEFIREADVNGTMLLGKMNSSNWQTQDKLYSEGYLMEKHLSEWHCYTLVYRNEYGEDGAIEDAFVYMYIDGKLAARSRLSAAAGLTYSLGSYDDGSVGDPNGGFNVGGYFENGLVKRGCTGALDNLMVFDGALSEEEINTLCYTVKVDKEYDPDIVDVAEPEETPAPTKEPEATPEPTKSPQPTSGAVTGMDQDGSSNTAVVVIVVVGAVILVGVVVVVLMTKRGKTR
ncbi:MAG: hypothetical protein K2N63_11010 [Lachnospiraceae bacterium]|nr:hypothetical protein [Lachnospiraceae bacterium]